MGDTPIAARELALRRAKGDAYAAMRLGRRMTVTREMRKHPPEPARLQLWASLFSPSHQSDFSKTQNLILTPAQVSLLKLRTFEAFTAKANSDDEFWADHSKS